ncbi:hypothetical protein RZQ35_04370 [Klebsiella quasipneumoniae subsp. quasipneumoniae]|uniref:hypothetical protein n=1 Tax=Klebsiella quasipneumoniae TaxID=1463165 RepID=UPI00292BECF1|nr:hypothetical protein [Klebsiella quasipneumoniae]MDV1504857.1 hypothetical protein [Klebsiella quasipneumoniae subsp. quasipneumoniae]MDV1519675.1 hypothetical protein [Klebsiella quasipneumoniae subsp. quasipneumoniae]MDV1556906.1 hypothetical protein [Klebsiella quasipneumoniae subsp. quasipneumoniae]MDV1579399.1 hypothetical protein [Klebsiella quasipneumoniae subsp. quasipneumoniae]MDW2622896.1 hypothetical protein [Klebsiella quasipneumoniae]
MYVLGQIIVKCALDPFISFKEHLGKISSLLLREQSKIMNFKANAELINELKLSAGLLIAKSKAIPCYKHFSKMGLLPAYNNVIDASHHLNLIASMLEECGYTYPNSKSPLSSGGSVYTSLKEIGEKLDIVVRY